MSDTRLTEIGKATTARLKKQPGVQVVNGIGFDLYIRQQFLTPQECGALIAMIDANRKPSELLSTDSDPTFRTSESCDLDRYHPYVAAIDARVCNFMGMKERQGETLQGQRYSVGQQFKPHHDFFHTNQPYWPDERVRGGQRSWTAMIYLDEPAGGGETHFPNAGFKISPRTGMLLTWNNMNADGTPNHQSLHESIPVSAGIKNIVTKWYRERFWM